MTPLKTVFRLDSVTKLADKLSVSVLAVLLSSTSLASQELPQNGQILSGTGSIVQDGADMSITQNSANLDINWNSFSIGAENTVTFKQPSATSTALNRVTGTQTSAIHGKMTANGRVFLLNPNGVMFGAGAQVNVGSLVASTLGLSKIETNNSGSQHQFEGDSAAAITNAGQIATNDGGTIALIAAKVTNTGSLTAPGGTVALGAGRRVRLDLGGTVALEVDEAAVDALITQGGAIRADGGLIYLGAKAAGDLAQTVINHSGTSQAQTLATGKDGRIFLMGDMRNDQIDVSGTLDASAPNGGDGGFVETSAAQLMLRDGLRVTTKAHLGKTGTWLIDPTDIEIIAGDNDDTANWSANQIKAGTINAALAGNNVEIKTAAADPASGAETGNITVNAGLTWGKNTLKLIAHDNIIINAKIDATGGDGTGTGGLVLHYGQNGLGTSSYRINAPIDLASGGSFKTQNGTDIKKEIDHTIITKLGEVGSMTGTDLQGMNGALGANGALGGNYVLGANIDASATSGWNDGKGFAPVGDEINSFTGTFDGLGHMIKNLTIKNPVDNDGNGLDTGLFGSAEGATFRNIGLTNVNISGSGYVTGGLLGYGDGITIENAYVTGKVTGTATATGGLVGEIENALINNSYVLGDVSGKNTVGGLAGSFSSSTITNAYATGAVSGIDYIGGLVGFSTMSNIAKVYATGAVSGTNYIGGLVGHANYETLIRGTFATGKVTGNTDVGGLVGQGDNIIIENTYATGPVTGDTNVAGLVGSSEKLTIDNTYAAGKVTGVKNVGGLIGRDVLTIIKASLWDTETTGQSQGIGKSDDNNGETSGATSAVLRTQKTYTDAGWDFTDTWFMLDGQTRPFLRFEHSQTITNPRQLQLMAMDRTLNYTLGADIDMQAALQASHKDGNTDRYSGMWGAAGFVPIDFIGSLDGLGHEIIGLKINRPDAERAGLFGLTVNANLQNITLRDATITGKTAGGLVGLAYDTSFTNITSHNSNVTGTDHVGGLVGQATTNTNFNTIRLDDINVTGTGNVGGLVGNAYQNTTIETSYAKGTVTSTGTNSVGTNAGGLVGWAVHADIKTSYAAADVSSTSETASNTVGGLVGSAINTNITNAYATGDVEASNKTVYIGGLVGKTDGVNTEDKFYKIENTYAMGKVTTPNDNSDQTHIGGLVGCNWARGDSECAGDTKEQTYKIINSFWDMTTTGRNESSRGASGKTNEEMDRLATFTNATWNISEKGGEDMVWRIYEGQAAPLLRAFMEKVQVTGTGPEARDYNGKTDATISDLQFAETVDDVTFASSGNGQYADANAGEDKTVTITYALANGETEDLHTVLQRYDFVEPELKGTINKKALTITANNASKTYGETQTFDGTEFTADNLQNGETISVNLTSAGAAKKADAGSYNITAETATAATGSGFNADNYTITYANGELKVAKRDLTITANDASKTYGDTQTFDGTEFTADALQNGETISKVNLTSAGAAETANVKDYTITAAAATAAEGSGFNADNYTITYANGELKVAKRDLTITANNASKTYGDTQTFDGTEFTADALQNNETISVTLTSAGAAETANVKDYTITAAAATAAEGSGFNADNYTITYANGELKVAKRDLTITANNASKTYGDTQTFDGTEFTAVALQNNETISVTLTSAGAAETANVKDYTITAAAATAAEGSGFNADNYTITYANGELKVAKRDLTITANNASKTYGDTQTFDGTEFTADALQNGETISKVTLTSAGAAETANVKDYTITAAAATGSGFNADNYTITYANGELKVTKRALTITANDVSKTYGETLAFKGTEFSADALQNNETIGSVKLTSDGTAATAGVDDYKIMAKDATGGTFDAGNYTISYADTGSLSVAKRDLTITANDASKIYGDTLAFKGTEFTADALQNGETISKVTLTSAGAAETANVKDYTITAAAATGSGFNADNYTITYKAGTLDVVEPLNVSGAVEPGSSSTVSKAPSPASLIRPETCVEINGMAPLVLNLPELTEYCVDTSGSNPAQFTLVEKSGIALPTASDLLSLAALRQ